MPTRLHLRDGTRLDEPPAVEGYVERIRPNSQLRQALYLTTHNGYLFTLLPAHAHHPPPPGFAAPNRGVGEVRRGAAQILRATGMLPEERRTARTSGFLNIVDFAQKHTGRPWGIVTAERRALE